MKPSQWTKSLSWPSSMRPISWSRPRHDERLLKRSKRGWIVYVSNELGDSVQLCCVLLCLLTHSLTLSHSFIHSLTLSHSLSLSSSAERLFECRQGRRRFRYILTGYRDIGLSTLTLDSIPFKSHRFKTSQSKRQKRTITASEFCTATTISSIDTI